MLARATVISRLRPPLAALILAIGMAFDAPATVDAVPLPLHDRHGIDPEIPALRGLAMDDRPYEVDLFRAGDFVSQAGPTKCMPAPILTMGRIIEDGAAATARRMTQARLYRLARRLSTPRLVGAGAEAEGWAGVLNRIGYGPVRRPGRPNAGGGARLGGARDPLHWPAGRAAGVARGACLADDGLPSDRRPTPEAAVRGHARRRRGSVVPPLQRDLRSVAAPRDAAAGRHAGGRFPPVPPTHRPLSRQGRSVRPRAGGPRCRPSCSAARGRVDASSASSEGMARVPPR